MGLASKRSISKLWCAVRATLLTRHDLPEKEEDDAKAGKLVNMCTVKWKHNVS